jgi:hypothetical protein
MHDQIVKYKAVSVKGCCSFTEGSRFQFTDSPNEDMSQKYVGVDMIGNQVFAVEIHPLSEETCIDFRRDYGALRYAVHCLPEAIEQALLRMKQCYRLNHAAVDMLSTPDGRYVYLETNSTGQFGWLDAMTDLPLSQTLAKLLAGRA